MLHEKTALYASVRLALPRRPALVCRGGAVFLLRQSDYMKSLGYEDVALDHVPEAASPA